MLHKFLIFLDIIPLVTELISETLPKFTWNDGVGLFKMKPIKSPSVL